jgi:DNA-binding ferritin-like protein
VKEEFDEHAKDESEHARAVAERINQLGGKPDFNPKGLESRAASQYGDADNRAGFNAQIVLLNKLYAIVIRTFVGI